MVSEATRPVIAKSQSQPAVEQIFFDAHLEQEFRSRGYIVVPLLSADEVRALRDHFEAAKLELTKDFFVTASNTDREYRKRVAEGISRFIEPAMQKLIIDYRCCQSHYVVKQAGGVNGRVPVHQDYTFLDPEGFTAVHVWAPLIDVDEMNGCLQVMPGSHTFFKHISAIGSNPHPYCCYPNVNDSEFMVSQIMKAGQALIYDGRLLHSSERNNSQTLRVAINCIMLPSGVKARLHKWQSETPQLFTRTEVSDEVFLNFDIESGVVEPYPQGVEVLEPIVCAYDNRSVADLRIHMEQLGLKRSNARSFSAVCQTIRKFVSGSLCLNKKKIREEKIDRNE